MEVYLIRHSTPEVAAGICYGRTDLSVREATFATELAAIRQLLPDDIEYWYSSPLRRCTRLAGALAPTYTTDDRLRELDFGDWEGLAWDSIDRTALEAWSEDFVYAAPPGGESFDALHQRSRQVYSELLETPYERVAIIAHAGNLRSLICHVLDLPLEQAFRLAVGYGTVVRLRLAQDERMSQLVGLWTI